MAVYETRVKLRERIAELERIVDSLRLEIRALKEERKDAKHQGSGDGGVPAGPGEG